MLFVLCCCIQQKLTLGLVTVAMSVVWYVACIQAACMYAIVQSHAWCCLCVTCTGNIMS